jgi:transcriptional regulator with XRE-family HTH domain
MMPTLGNFCGTCTVVPVGLYLDDRHVPNLSQNRQSPELIALGGAIKQVRLARKVSQEQLALLAEVDRSYLGRVERGDNNPAALTLVKIAAALGTTAAELFTLAKLYAGLIRSCSALDVEPVVCAGRRNDKLPKIRCAGIVARRG